MAKRYRDVKLEEGTYARFKQVKNLFQFQNKEEYHVSEFVDILLDHFGKRLGKELQQITKDK